MTCDGLAFRPGPVSRKPRKFFGPVKPLQNLEPCDYRPVLLTHSKDEGRFPSYKKFQACTPLRFLDTDDLKMALRARKLSGALEKRTPGGVERQLWASRLQGFTYVKRRRIYSENLEVQYFKIHSLLLLACLQYKWNHWWSYASCVYPCNVCAKDQLKGTRKCLLRYIPH